jgi:histidine ammonia-lyase
MAARKLVLDGHSLTCKALSQLGYAGSQISIAPDAMRRINQSRAVIDGLVDRGFNEGHVAYGINTGFGLFSDVVIEHSKLRQLQTNLVRSHCAGVGTPLSREETRRLLALRINILTKGHSGIRQETVDRMVAAFNADCISVVPSQGTVGASGDLAPLSHLALGLMGEGPMWDPETGTIGEASEILARHGLTPILLEAKEGLAMINGTQMMSSITAHAVTRAKQLALAADIACALSVEGLKGTPRHFEECIHAVRPHSGQVAVAKRMMQLLTPTSEIWNSHNYHGKVQDAYSLRCTPQVHGVCHDTIEFVERVLDVELNSATDNPMIFTKEDGVKLALHDPNYRKTAGYEEKGNVTMKRPEDTYYEGEGGFVISGGNFHGEYPAKMADYLAIGVAELGNISERRLERLVNPTISELPAFLAYDPGLDSGHMITHCTSAALVSENKVLCHPASVDTISTSASKEDHVSMGGFAARKSMKVVENVENIIAIEIVAACEALEHFKPNKSTPALNAVYEVVRSKVPPLKGDRHMSPDVDNVAEMLRSGQITGAVEPFMK